MRNYFVRVYFGGIMGFKRSLKSFAERLTNTRIFRTLPRGVDLFFDCQKCLPAYRARVVVDVGANIGETARQFRKHFPESTIHCIEPVSDVFEKLALNLNSLHNIHCHRLAMGNSDCVGRLLIHSKSTMGRLQRVTIGDPHSSSESSEVVKVQTLDNFCEEHGIAEIDFLKVDTEGHDLAVVEGASRMLKKQAIRLVQLEAGMNRENTWHVPFHKLHEYLEEQGYRLFGIYEQKEEWPTKAPNLRRCNSVYISRSLVEANSPCSR